MGKQVVEIPDGEASGTAAGVVEPDGEAAGTTADWRQSR